MYIKFQYGLLYFSDYPAEGFKPVVLNQPPFLEDDEIAIYHWTQNLYYYEQIWDVIKKENLIEDSEALNILLQGNDD